MAGLSGSAIKYANAADLNAYLGETLTDPEADALLHRASSSIRDFTRTAYYQVESDGYTASDPKIADAMHDATILQAAALWRARVTPGMTVADLPKAIQAKTLGARSVTYAANATADQALAALVNGSLSPEAVSVLSQARLLSTSVFTGGGTRYNILTRQWGV